MSNMICPYCNKQLNESQYSLLDDKLYKSCPTCSSAANKHAHYFCPQLFGYTAKRTSLNNPIGMQSSCARCRANHEGPYDDAVFCDELINKGGHLISEIRFLSMSKELFKTNVEVKTFILDTMVTRGGTYFYKESKMIVVPDSFVLFQFDETLVGYGVCTANHDFDNVNNEGYSGYYQFDNSTIRFLDKPITSIDYSKIDKEFKSFNQAHQKRNAGLFPSIFQLISQQKTIAPNDSNIIEISEELPSTDLDAIIEGAKKQITVNAYERNPVARRECLKYFKQKNNGIIKCEICGFQFSKVYGKQFEEKIHVHHIVEISSIGDEYKVNPTTDLIPICPNCHMIIHSRKPAYKPEEVMNMINSNKHDD